MEHCFSLFVCVSVACFDTLLAYVLHVWKQLSLPGHFPEDAQSRHTASSRVCRCKNRYFPPYRAESRHMERY